MLLPKDSQGAGGQKYLEDGLFVKFLLFFCFIAIIITIIQIEKMKRKWKETCQVLCACQTLGKRREGRNNYKWNEKDGDSQLHYSFF